MKVPSWTPFTTTVSDMLLQARSERVIMSQSGLMDGEKAAVVAAYGKDADWLMRQVQKHYSNSEQRSIHTFQDSA
jgi:hypothetical protein